MIAEIPSCVEVAIGSLEIGSGVLAIMWSAESGECIQSLDVADYGRPTGPMSTGSSALLIKVPRGRYLCLHDELSLEDGQSAVRCNLMNNDYQDYQTWMDFNLTNNTGGLTTEVTEYTKTERNTKIV